MTTFKRLRRLFRKNDEDKATAEQQTSNNVERGYPIFPPPPPAVILKNSHEYHDILLKRRFFGLEGHLADTPLFALYRMYEHLMLNGVRGLRNELERFWYNKRPVSSIPDPEDQASPERYAVLACIPALMVTAFNERVRIGISRWAEPIILEEEMEAVRNAEKIYETVPEWTVQVPAVQVTLRIPHDDRGVLQSFGEEGASLELAAKNILCLQPHIHFM